MLSPAKSMPMLRLRVRRRPGRGGSPEQHPQLVDQRDVGHRQVAGRACPGLGERGDLAVREPVPAGVAHPVDVGEPAEHVGGREHRPPRAGEPLELVPVVELGRERLRGPGRRPAAGPPTAPATSARRASGPAALGCCTRWCSSRRTRSRSAAPQPQHLRRRTRSAATSAHPAAPARISALQEPAHPQRALERGQRRRIEPVRARCRPRSRRASAARRCPRRATAAHAPHRT